MRIFLSPLFFTYNVSRCEAFSQFRLCANEFHSRTERVLCSFSCRVSVICLRLQALIEQEHNSELNRKYTTREKDHTLNAHTIRI